MTNHQHLLLENLKKILHPIITDEFFKVTRVEDTYFRFSFSGATQFDLKEINDFMSNYPDTAYGIFPSASGVYGIEMLVSHPVSEGKSEVAQELYEDYSEIISFDDIDDIEDADEYADRFSDLCNRAHEQAQGMER